MKNNVLKISLVMLGVMVLATPVLAATIVSFSPANVSISQGKTFNVTVAINPQGVSNYTAKIQLDYPADVLEIKSFTLGSNWMALAQPGYDLIDNTNGVLIKTGGYPGGLSSSATFGTVSFYAKKAGSGVIKAGNGSLALDANNQNVFSGTPEVAFTVTAVAPVAPSQPAVPAPAVTPTTPVAPTPQPTAQQPVTPTVAPTSLAAAIGGILTLGTGNVWVGILVGLVILAIVIYAIYVLVQKKRNNLGEKIY
ncbi:MAG: hypothetical protein NT039_03640 [Candidatus Berkelbacteria bacterium]|nr:hypothetical protein [Candidatus Berkelbacteria bacterium]